MSTISMERLTREGVLAGDRSPGVEVAWADLCRFGAVALQFGLLVGIVGTYDIENQELGNVL